jgi:hypothetical protein
MVKPDEDLVARGMTLAHLRQEVLLERALGPYALSIMYL